MSTTRVQRMEIAKSTRRLVEGCEVPLPMNWSYFLSLSENKADPAHFISGQLLLQLTEDVKTVSAGGFREKLTHSQVIVGCN